MTQPKQFDPSQVNAFMIRMGGLILLLIVILFAPLGYYAWHLDHRMESVQNSLRYHPPSDTEGNATPVMVRGNFQVAHPSHGQLVYVPAYSHVYHGSGDGHLLAVTLSIRNASAQHPITINSARYYDTAGKEIKSYFSKPITIAPLGTEEILVERNDASGGSGANFLVEWVAEQTVAQPVIEAIMIDTNSQQGISFARSGTVIGELIPEDSDAEPAETVE